MKKSYIFSLFAAAALITTGCSKENPFEGYGNGSEGQFLKSALAVDIDADGLDARTTRAAEADVNQFNILFYAEGQAQPFTKYLYGEMPEVVTLPAGNYTVTATYGENRDAAWDSPHFLGNSESFEVKPMEIVSFVEPIVCHLENIKVTIDFDSVLREHMSSDSYAEVKVGSSSSLRYGLDEAINAKAGYFMHSDEFTLVAVFNGKVDGAEVVETKSLRDIQKGYHYKITFRLHEGSDPDITGGANLDGVTVDAAVEAIDVTANVPLIQDELLEDDERPKEGELPVPDEPGKEDPVTPDDPNAKAPTIVGVPPVDIDNVNYGSVLGDNCVLNITSYADGGITYLTCDIVSDILTPDLLQGLDLDSHLDLVNTPDDQQEALRKLNFPVLVGGQSEVVFDISPFISILGNFGSNLHKFIITVKDANGECTKTLQIQY